jgi:TrmH family RNA methyltransferase
MRTSKAQIKFVRSLKLKKFRQKYNKFVAEGDKIVQDLIQHQANLVDQVFALPDWLETNKALLYDLKAKCFELNEKELATISSFQTPNHVLTVGNPPDCALRKESAQQSLSLYLDGLQDPGNLGTIIRIADWFGISNVIGSPNTVEIWNPKVVQASMGAVFKVNYFQQSIQDLKTALPAVPVLGADKAGTDLFEFQWPEAAILVIGNEGQGISPDTHAAIQQNLTIPAIDIPLVDSLNAAMATSILVANYRQVFH